MPDLKKPNRSAAGDGSLLLRLPGIHRQTGRNPRPPRAVAGTPPHSFFIAKYPDLSVKELLTYLGVSKQALNTPLRQLMEMHLVESVVAADDKRKRLLSFTPEGAKLEKALRREQAACWSACLMRSAHGGRELAERQPGSGAYSSGRAQRLADRQ